MVYSVVTSWQYPTESGRDICSWDFESREEALAAAEEMCSQEKNNFEKVTGCDAFDPAPVEEFGDFLIVTPKNGLDKWFFSAEVVELAGHKLRSTKKETVDEVCEVTSMKPGDAVPVSRELRKDEDHVALICKAFIYDEKWYDGTNMYAKRQHVWERTLEDLKGNDVKCYAFDKGPYDKDSKRLFMPTDAEIQAALDEFKKKGWHAQYDSDVGYYAVFEGTRALGEYQARYTRNLF